MVAWVRRPGMSVHHGVHSDGFYGFLAGVWGDFPLGPEKLEARQYALFFDLGACNFFEGKGAVKGTPKCVVINGSGGCLYHVRHFQFAQGLVGDTAPFRYLTAATKLAAVAQNV
jgi:hypothetical protein